MNKRILNTCLRTARQRNTVELHPEYGNFHHYSFIVQDNKIIEYATNRCGKVLYSKFYERNCKTHAEANAYKKAKGLLKPGTFEVVNIRLNRAGDLRNSAPCSGCSALLNVMGAKRVWFTTKDDTFDKVTL
jgi:tRNA(Arg) A34 adenosine deaminase TadA